MQVAELLKETSRLSAEERAPIASQIISGLDTEPYEYSEHKFNGS